MIVQVAYSGTAPGGDSNTYLLFSTTGSTTTRAAATQPTSFVKGSLPQNNIHKLLVRIKHNQAGTINWYMSDNEGTTWRQLGTQAIAAPASTDGTYQEFLVEGEMDFKVEWVNSGSAQTTWAVQLSLTDDRAAAV